LPEVREGTLKGGLPYVSVGDSPPLVVFVAGGPTNANSTGWLHRYEVRWPRVIDRRRHDLKDPTRRDRCGEDRRAHFLTISFRASMEKVDQFADSDPENYVN
jgi:hypothetical protein